MELFKADDPSLGIEEITLLANLMWRVSRKFYRTRKTRVFETLTIRAKDYAIYKMKSHLYSPLNLTRPLEYHKLIEHLCLRAPFHSYFELATRCLGY